MNENINNGLVPILRFKDFQGKDEWNVEPLGELYSFKLTNAFSRDDLSYINGLVKNIHYGDIHTKFSTLFDISKETVPYVKPSIAIDKISPESYCKEGDIIFADASEDIEDVGKSIEIINLNNEKLLAGLHTLLARQKEAKLTLGFGGYLFKSNNIRAQIKREAQGSKVYGISSNRISDVKVYYPEDKAEQQKIAACLSSLDDLTAAHKEKLEALKAHKKGLMQQLFPAERELVPRLRFERFRGTGEWAPRRLRELVDLLSGYPFPGSEISEDTSGVPLLRGINITEGYIRHNKDIDRFYLGNDPNLNKFIIQTGDLVIAMDGSKVGKNSAIISDKDTGALLVQRITRLRSTEEGMIEFIFQHINSHKFHNYVDRINTSSGIPHISMKQIEEFQILCPPTEEERLLISNCLSALDYNISIQTDKICMLKNFKHGLMNGLFPALNNIGDYI